jgi:hypothetical protein
MEIATTDITPPPPLPAPPQPEQHEHAQEPPLEEVASRPRRARGVHWEMLTMCVVALVLSAILQVRDDGRCFIPGFASHPLPEACLSLRALGIKCPGCGLTRRLVCLAHGNWHDAFSYNRVGWAIFLAAVLQVPYRLAAIRLGRSPIGTFVPRYLPWVLITLLLGNYLIDIARGELHIKPPHAHAEVTHVVD